MMKKRTPEQRAAHAEKERQRRANISPEQRAAYYRQWRASLAPERKAAHAEKERQRGKNAILSDRYFAKLIGLPETEVPVELLEMKREQMTLKRLARELKRQLKENDNGSTEQQDAGQPGQSASRDDHG